MCYKVATPEAEALENYLLDVNRKDVQLLPFDLYYHANGFSYPMLPVELSAEPNKIQPAQWRLLPHWVKNEEEAKKYANTLNATCEDIFDKSSYKSYIGKNRCVLYVQGFYEPHHPRPKVSQPYFVYRNDHKPFMLGGVYAPWVNKDTGELINTFAVITVPANTLLGKIHNEKGRMPLVITEENRERWLGNLTREEVTDLMKPLPDGILTGHPVSSNINKKNIETNVPEILAEVPVDFTL